MAFEEEWEEDPRDYFDAAAAQKHLLVVRAFDAPRYYRTPNNKDGMVYPNRQRGQSFEPFPNMVVRCAVADLDHQDEDGNFGTRIYEQVVLFPSSITKVAKLWVGKGPQLLMWRKGPNQTDQFELRNMKGNDECVARGTEFLKDHPEFMEIPAPDKYDERPSRDDRDDDRGGRRDDRGRDDGWIVANSRRDERGYRDERDRDYDPRGNGRQRGNGGPRDWGQHDDRRPAPRQRDDDNWDRGRGNGGGDGSFMSRSRNHQGDYQDQEPPW